MWCTGVAYNEQEQRWNIFFVAYRGIGPDLDGKIFHAVLPQIGRDGIDGPYQDVDIVMRQDEHSQDWEGDQAVDS